MTNEVIKAMIERRSCRKFKAEQIKKLEKNRKKVLTFWKSRDSI